MNYKKTIKTYSRAKPINIKSFDSLRTPVVQNEAFDMLNGHRNSKTPDIIVSDWNDTFDRLKYNASQNSLKYRNSVKSINFEDSSLVTEDSHILQKQTLGKKRKITQTSNLRTTSKRKCKDNISLDKSNVYKTIKPKKLKNKDKKTTKKPGKVLANIDNMPLFPNLNIEIERANSFLASTPVHRKKYSENLHVSPISLKNLNSGYSMSLSDKRKSLNISGSPDYKKWDELKGDCKLLSSTRVHIAPFPVSLSTTLNSISEISNCNTIDSVKSKSLNNHTSLRVLDDVSNVNDDLSTGVFRNDTKLLMPVYVKLFDSMTTSKDNKVSQDIIETNNKETVLSIKTSIKSDKINKQMSKKSSVLSKKSSLVLENKRSRSKMTNGTKNYNSPIRKKKSNIGWSDLATKHAVANENLDEYAKSTGNPSKNISGRRYSKRITNKLQRGKTDDKLICDLIEISEEPIVIEDTVCVIDDSKLEKSSQSRSKLNRTNKETEYKSLRLNNSKKQEEINISEYDNSISKNTAKRITLIPGKKWRRSLAIFNQLKTCNNALRPPEQNFQLGQHLVNNCEFKKGRNWRDTVFKVIEDQQNTSIAPDAYGEKSFYDIANLSLVHKKKAGCFISPANDSIKQVTSDVLVPISNSVANDIDISSDTANESEDGLLIYNYLPVTPREIVLRRCGQTDPLPFSEVYPDSSLLKCQKIGEGLFGEVYLYKNATGECSVMKIIPIEGEQLVNGEPQKKFNEILSEIIIVMELSNLRSNTENRTIGFSEVKTINCVQGPYPEPLIDLWDLYDEVRGSENDSPIIFGENQLYIVLELGNAGKDFEAFEFTNAKQCYSVFVQTALALSVAEKALQFEHRDLHWGNVLICPTTEKTQTYILDNRTFVIPTHGVKSTIIDFTFSRISLDGNTLFTDLNSDEDLFSGTGDYQFDIYRLMKEKNRNNWKIYEPYSNILWLHYLADKMISGARYKRINSKIHKQNINELSRIKDSLLEYQNVQEFVEDFEFNI